MIGGYRIRLDGQHLTWLFRALVSGSPRCRSNDQVTFFLPGDLGLAFGDNNVDLRRQIDLNADITEFRELFG